MSRTRRKYHTPYGMEYDNCHDKKKWYKPNATFKKFQKKRRKAKERQGVRRVIEEKQDLPPKFPKTDTWDWN